MLETVPGVKCTTADGQWCERPPSVLIQQRFRKIIPEFQSWVAAKTLLIAELDDEPEAIGVSPMCFKAVHAVQVSTEPLAEIARQWNPNVMVFENQIADLPAPNFGVRHPNRISIFYGAQNRQSDWKPIMPALLRVLADHPEVMMCVIHDHTNSMMCSFHPLTGCSSSFNLTTNIATFCGTAISLCSHSSPAGSMSARAI